MERDTGLEADSKLGLTTGNEKASESTPETQLPQLAPVSQSSPAKTEATNVEPSPSRVAELERAIARLTVAIGNVSDSEISALVVERASMRAELEEARRATGRANVIPIDASRRGGPRT